jgi:hypothetical protein
MLDEPPKPPISLGPMPDPAYDSVWDAVFGGFCVIVLYQLCYGATVWGVAPIQRYFFGENTTLASLVFLPHGVRVLTTYFWRLRAVPVLFLAGLVGHILLNSDDFQLRAEPVIYLSVLVGAMSAFLAFEILRLVGLNCYAHPTRPMHWKQVLLSGLVASLLNSIGQSVVYSGMVVPDQAFETFLAFAVGDLMGLIVSLLILLVAFRTFAPSSSAP